MKRLQEKIVTKEDFKYMMEILSERVKTNKSITDNGMLDGMIIGLMLTTEFTEYLFLGKELGRVLDGTMQKLEQIAIWSLNNHDQLDKLL